MVAKKRANKKQSGRKVGRPKTKDSAVSGREHSDKMAMRSRTIHSKASDIGPIPQIVDPARKKRCRNNLSKFLVEYFPQSTGLYPNSEDHDRADKSMQFSILDSGKYINAVYRGFGKTTKTQNSVLWAILYGHRKLVPIFSADQELGNAHIKSILDELETNPLLMEDFPEVCYPIMKLEGKHQRCNSQHSQGVPTNMVMKANEIVLPTVKLRGRNTPASGAQIKAFGFLSSHRGLNTKLPDGTVQRPDFAIIDDPQTDVSARSPEQVRKRLAVLSSMLRMAGHDRDMSVVCNATVIENGDMIHQLLDHNEHPEWEGIRVQMVKMFADRHDDLWLQEYKKIRTSYNPEVPGDLKRAQRDSTEFYRKNRAAMDAGCVISWEYAYDKSSELSAIQHAYNILIDEGEESFWSECQNDPKRAVVSDMPEIMVKDLAAKMTDYWMGTVPNNCRTIGMGIDVHKELLYYTITAFPDDFSVFPILYGTFPEQNRARFKLSEANPTIADKYPDIAPEEQIKQAVRDLINHLMPKGFENPNGDKFSISYGLVDAGWGEMSEAVRQGVLQSNHADRVFPAFGKGVTGNETPMLELSLKQGEYRSFDESIPWRSLTSTTHGSRTIQWDTNAVKTFLRNRMSTPLGGASGFALPRQDSSQKLYAEHLLSEYAVFKQGKRRPYYDWTLPKNRPDNHWLDTLNMSIVSASMAGITVIRKPESKPSKPKKNRRKRKKVSYG